MSAPQAWNGRNPNLMSNKTPTCLLLDKDRNIDSFGFEADDMYANLCLEGVIKKYCFFRRFKMKLPKGEASDVCKFCKEIIVVKAGILSDNLDIALEPEIASLYCQYLPIDKFFTQKGQVHFGATPTNTKYMVLDLGGGTADITVHEKLAGGKLKEVVKASGGPWGGTAVEAAFFRLITDIVDKPVMTAFQDEK